MADHQLLTAAKHTALPFSSGVLFFLVLMGIALATDRVAGLDYAVSNDAVVAIGPGSIIYFFFAAWFGDLVFGWKKKTGSRLDFLADLSRSWAENLYFILGVSCGFCLFAILAAAMVPEFIPAAAQAAIIGPATYAITLGICLMRGVIHEIYSLFLRSVVLIGLTLLALGLLWWTA